MVTTLTRFPMNLTFDDLRPRLLIHEQRLKSPQELEEHVVTHPDLTISHAPSVSSTLASISNSCP